jgi:hypothetical protein
MRPVPQIVAQHIPRLAGADVLFTVAALAVYLM